MSQICFLFADSASRHKDDIQHIICYKYTTVKLIITKPTWQMMDLLWSLFRPPRKEKYPFCTMQLNIMQFYKHMLAVYVLNPSLARHQVAHTHRINTMPANTLAPYVTNPSAVRAWYWQNKPEWFPFGSASTRYIVEMSRISLTYTYTSPKFWITNYKLPTLWKERVWQYYAPIRIPTPSPRHKEQKTKNLHPDGDAQKPHLLYNSIMLCIDRHPPPHKSVTSRLVYNIHLWRR